MKNTILVFFFLLTQSNVYCQVNDSVFFNKGTQLLYYSPNFVYAGSPTENFTIYKGFEHNIGYTRYIASRYALRSNLSYGYAHGFNDFPLDITNLSFNVGHQYQIFKRRRSPFHLAQEFMVSRIGDRYENEVYKTVGTSLLFGFISPLFKKYPKLYLGMEGGYKCYYTTQDYNYHIKGAPLLFSIQYCLTKSIHATPKKIKNTKK